MQPDDWSRLANFVAGEGSPAELAETEKWAKADADRSAVLAAMLSAWDLGADQTAAFDKTKAWESILRRKAARAGDTTFSQLASGEPATAAGPKLLHLERGSRSRSRSRKFVPIAIAACALVAVATSVRFITRHDPKPAQVTNPPRDFITSRGQRAELRLTDGTMVILGAQSRLSVPADYDSITRNVTLEGEAYFDVVHNSSRPFIVRTGKLEVRDVGTRFDVREYSSAELPRVLVTEGEVELQSRNAANGISRPLVRGQIARLHSDGTFKVASNVDTSAFLSWTSGELIFNRAPASQAVLEISRWYDVDIVLDPALHHRTLTAVLRDQVPSEVVKLVAISLDARVVRTGSRIYLTP